jgi:hypothetical protein
LCCYNDRKQEQTGELTAVVDATADAELTGNGVPRLWAVAATAAVNFLFPAQSIFSSVP